MKENEIWKLINEKEIEIKENTVKWKKERKENKLKIELLEANMNKTK